MWKGGTLLNIKFAPMELQIWLLVNKVTKHNFAGSIPLTYLLVLKKHNIK